MSEAFRARKAKGFTKPKVEYNRPGPASQQAEEDKKEGK